MILFDLFLGFLKVGCFAFGGAYGAIPLIRDVVLSYGWLTDEAITYMIAVSESTPGPIMINLATYIGSSQGGLLGAVIATLAVVLPSFIIMLVSAATEGDFQTLLGQQEGSVNEHINGAQQFLLVITALLSTLLKNKYVQAVLRGLKPCVIGIVLATGAYMIFKHCFLAGGILSFNLREVLLTALLGGVMIGYKKLKKKKLSPILLILISAVAGIVIYSL